MNLIEPDLYVGFFHERPDGSLVYTHRAGFGTVDWRDNDNKQGEATYEEYVTWKLRRDLQDFPNARDPKLPYVFDLYWDIKYQSDLEDLLNNERFEDRAALLEQIEKHQEVKARLK